MQRSRAPPPCERSYGHLDEEIEPVKWGDFFFREFSQVVTYRNLQVVKKFLLSSVLEWLPSCPNSTIFLYQQTERGANSFARSNYVGMVQNHWPPIFAWFELIIYIQLGNIRKSVVKSVPNFECFDPSSDLSSIYHFVSGRWTWPRGARSHLGDDAGICGTRANGIPD